jgi:hypothetical protein
MSFRLCLLIAFAYLALCYVAGVASAYVGDPGHERELAVAEQYWGRPAPADLEIIKDYAMTANVCGLGELGGKRIWIGACYDGADSTRRAYIIAHELGHIFGYGHDYVGDPNQIMNGWNPPTWFADPVEEAERSADIAKAATVAQASVDYSRLLDAWGARRAKRDACMLKARNLEHRKQRVKARGRCDARYPKTPMPTAPQEHLP